VIVRVVFSVCSQAVGEEKGSNDGDDEPNKQGNRMGESEAKSSKGKGVVRDNQPAFK
jgi:hypothetical protein